jgi:hypothetical protein
MSKVYLGDAVFAQVVTGNLLLSTEDGQRVTNLIVFEPQVLVALGDYLGKNLSLPQQSKDQPNPIPTVTMQQILDGGFNAFGLQLFAESVAGKKDAKTFKPFAFNFRNIKITLEPVDEVDTSHH